MNNERRKMLEAVRLRLDSIKELIDGCVSDLEDIKSEESDYFDNMPESFQSGEKGDKAQEAVSSLDNAISDLESIDLESVCGQIEDAAQ